MSQDDFERGLATRRKVLGAPYVDKALGSRTDFNADFQDLVTRHAWHDVWNRPHFDARHRRIIVISQLVALGAWDEFRLHTRAALESGDLSQADVREILLQTAVYCGVPAANTAFKEARAIIDGLAARG
jgi:4-carboxymuconolactone decarboxylase